MLARRKSIKDTVKLVKEMVDEVPVKVNFKATKREQELEEARMEGFRSGFQSAQQQMKEIQHEYIMEKNQLMQNMDAGTNQMFLRFSRAILQLGKEELRGQQETKNADNS